MPPDLPGLAALHPHKRHAADRGYSEIGKQVLERKNVCGDRLRDGDFLNAADVTDFPVVLRAFGVGVVTTDAGGSHDDWGDQPDTIAEHRTGRVDDLLVGIVAQALQGRFLESVQLMRCAVLEGKIGNKAIVDVPLLFADDLVKFQRQCCGNGYRARNGLIIVYYLGSTRMGQNPSDDIGGVIGPDAADDRVEVVRLPSERGLCEIRQIHPHRDRERGQQYRDKKPRQHRGAYGSGGLAFFHGGNSDSSASLGAMLSSGMARVKLSRRSQSRNLTLVDTRLNDARAEDPFAREAEDPFARESGFANPMRRANARPNGIASSLRFPQ